MADQMSETFIALARTGNPNNKQIPLWKKYTMARRETMVFDVPSHLENDPRGAERRLFAKVPYVQPGRERLLRFAEGERFRHTGSAGALARNGAHSANTINANKT